MFKSVKVKSLFLFAALIGSLTLSAQEQNVSDSDLNQFADAYIKVQMQNQVAQQEMMTIIENEGLAVERFSAIQEAAIDPNKESDATAEEMKKHASAMSKMEKLQPELEQKAVDEIESAGISIDRYKSLATAIQKERSLQERLQAILMERQGN
ncbi:DUF4168 domain-containing protein [Gelidibacter maritimus]|uniref:DUF4168 domain-containing protein n=1 Tax=Gelidibacter maritimus TaxID=2761487 RepID=A0A7W2R3C9_9FLAO|nr:DUF4168 domain-containing protein [Gelidibacter maritimus]MBA6152488.1 DUF4168 domain-containing protein [Gelidibacter maritimus]